MKKWMIAAGILVLSALVLLGCVKTSEKENKAGVSADKMEDGFYVRSGGLFYPLEAEGKAYDGDMVKLTNSGSAQVVWLFEKAMCIPVLGAGDALVIRQRETLPEQIFLQSMEDRGTTLGMTLAQTATLGVYGLAENSNRRFCPGSSAEAALTALARDNKNLRIDEVGGVKLSEDKLSDIHTFEGLEPGESYVVGVYEGSHYQEVKMQADTRVFISIPEKRFMASQYRYTREGYAEVALPEHLPPGYYYVNDAGMLLVKDGGG